MFHLAKRPHARELLVVESPRSISVGASGGSTAVGLFRSRAGRAERLWLSFASPKNRSRSRRADLRGHQRPGPRVNSPPVLHADARLTDGRLAGHVLRDAGEDAASGPGYGTRAGMPVAS